MIPPSMKQLKKTLLPRRLTPISEIPHRTTHGGTGYSPATVQNEHYQPQDQDGDVEILSKATDLNTRRRWLAGEPEDARITGGTRSLMRRLTGLNFGSAVRRAGPVVPVLPAKTPQVA